MDGSMELPPETKRDLVNNETGEAEDTIPSLSNLDIPGDSTNKQLELDPAARLHGVKSFDVSHKYYKDLQYDRFGDSNFSNFPRTTSIGILHPSSTSYTSTPISGDVDADIGIELKDIKQEESTYHHAERGEAEQPVPISTLSSEGPKGELDGHKKSRLTYTFQDASFAIEDKTLLHPCNGSFKSGELVAIMGPSGCGKSTLLTMLAGKKTQAYSGNYYLNGKKRKHKELIQISSYVPQADNLRATLSVRETFYYYTVLKTRLGTEEAAHERVNWLLKNLHLEVCADSLIGDENVRGVSGGQKRRVSIGKALIAHPKVIFLDEPTSGLSSTDALTLVECLRKIADDADTLIISVIHQPRFSVFAKFDQLYLIASGGRTTYCGGTVSAVEYFSKLGHDVPMNENFADVALDIVTRGCFPDDKIDALIAAYDIHLKPGVLKKCEAAIQEGDHAEEDEDLVDHERNANGFVRGYRFQAKILLKLSLLLHFRDYQTTIRRVITYIIAGVITGLIFLTGTYFIAGEALRFIAGLFTALLLVMVLTLDRLPKLIEDRAFYKSDRADGVYSTMPFFIVTPLPFILETVGLVIIFGTIHYWMVFYNSSATTWLFCVLQMELVYLCTDSLMLLLSGACDTAATANGLTVSVIAVFALFGGFLVNTGTSPKWLYWINFLSFFYYSWSACITQVFSGFPDQPANATDEYFKTSEEVFYTFGIKTELKWYSILILAGFFTIFRVGAALCYKYLWNPKI